MDDFFRTIVLISYSIYSFYFYLLHRPQPFVGQSIFWARFLIFHSNIGLTAHSIAFWVISLLAIIQLRIVSKPHETIIDFPHVSRLIRIISITTCLLMIPNNSASNIVSQPAYVHLPDLYDKNSNETVVWISTKPDEEFEKTSFVIIALCFKTLPISILIIFSILLISNLRRTRQLSNRHPPRIVITSSLPSTPQLPTTNMVLLTVFLTLLIEFPRAFLFLFSGFNADFFYIYSCLADTWDLTSIGTSFVTFIVYSLTCRQIRFEISKFSRESSENDRNQSRSNNNN